MRFAPLFLLLFVACGGPVRSIGLVNGRLQPCPDTPNCVSTQAEISDTEHFMPALSFTGDASVAVSKVVAAIAAMPRSTLITQADTYIHAEFRSRVFRFADDVEFVIDDVSKTIHFRSAARLGRGDMGVNCNRMAELSAVLEPALIEP